MGNVHVRTKNSKCGSNDLSSLVDLHVLVSQPHVTLSVCSDVLACFQALVSNLKLELGKAWE